MPEFSLFLLKIAGFFLISQYLLAMALTYFKRAGLPTSEYTRINLFTALYVPRDDLVNEAGPLTKPPGSLTKRGGSNDAPPERSLTERGSNDVIKSPQKGVKPQTRAVTEIPKLPHPLPVIPAR